MVHILGFKSEGVSANCNNTNFNLYWASRWNTVIGTWKKIPILRRDCRI